MKKLALAFASVALLATPVFACPHSDKADDAAAPRTAEKDKKEAPKADKAKETPAKDTAKTAKPAEKTTEKKPDKVSAR